MRIPFRARSTGFTLVELILVITILGIFGAYAFMKNGSAAVYTLYSQSRTMASQLRHAQALATVWGRSVRVSATAGANGTYSVSCVSGTSSPCDHTPVLDPATGQSFSVTLEKGVVLAGPSTLDFDSHGKPSASATYTLTAGSETITLTVAALTGFVSVSP